MNEKQMSFEGMCARIKRMHTELEELEKALKEGVLDEGEQWTFPEDNYTVLAIWMLYDPKAQRLFAENEEQLLAVYYDIPAEGCGQFMTTAEISDKLVIKGSIKKPMSLSKLGMILQQQGFRSKRINHGKTRGWIVRERDTEEINANRNIEGRG